MRPVEKRLSRLPSRLLRILIFCVCAGYVLWGMDWGEVARAFSRFGVAPMLAAAAFSQLPLLPITWRLRFLTANRAGFPDAFRASLLCYGLNNILPAKLGELAKALYLRKNSGINMGGGLGLIFWERFFDLNIILCIGLLSALSFRYDAAVYSLAAVVGGAWVCIFLIRAFPGLTDRVIGRVPGMRLQALLGDIVQEVRQATNTARIAVLGLWSALVWGCFLAAYYVVVAWVARLDLSAGQICLAFMIKALSYAVPSSPGSLGVFEAAVILSLGGFGVGKETGLAVSLLLRLTHHVPQVLGGLAVMAASRLHFRDIRSLCAGRPAASPDPDRP